MNTASERPKLDSEFPTADATTEVPYKILQLVGSGAMGSVYKAREPALAQLVAIQAIWHDLMSGLNEARAFKVWRRFAQEAHALARLSHPGVATEYP